MTELHFRNTEECINRIKSIKEMYAKDTPSEVALKDAINALEKQIAKKPIFSEDKKFALCPCCDMKGLIDKQGYCDDCGQKLDWSDTN